MQLLYQEPGQGVEFEYSLPSGAVKETPGEDDGYDWGAGPWGECDAVCGGGYRVRQVRESTVFPKKLPSGRLPFSTFL